MKKLEDEEKELDASLKALQCIKVYLCDMNHVLQCIYTNLIFKDQCFMKANAKIDDLKMLIKKQKVDHSAKKSSIEAEIKALKTGIRAC